MTGRKMVVLLAALGVAGMAFASPAAAQEPRPVRSVCTYPRYAPKRAFRSTRPNLFITSGEREPNNDAAQAQPLPLGFDRGEDPDVDVKGSIERDDVDFFSFEVEAGDVMGVACVGRTLDSTLTLSDERGDRVMTNDNHGGVAGLYPPDSPLPAADNPHDAAFTFVFPRAGRYTLQLAPYGSSMGSYHALLRLRRPPLRSQRRGSRQAIFLDFDGAKIDALQTFGKGGREDAVLSPTKAYLPAWGLEEKDLDPLVTAVVANVGSHFDLLRGSGGNGDRGTTARDGELDFQILNSRDDPDPGERPNVARLIVGGGVTELGIRTIGLAQYVDPGNFATRDTAVVLLDLLSAPAPHPDSINSIATAPGVSKVDAVARVVAAVASHELGHLLGCWHCLNDNETVCLMDEGGRLLNMAGTGPDKILGTADDAPHRFCEDEYAPEGIGEDRCRQNTHTRAAFALSTGTLDDTASRQADEFAILQADLLEQQSRRGERLLSGREGAAQPFTIQHVAATSSTAEARPGVSPGWTDWLTTAVATPLNSNNLFGTTDPAPPTTEADGGFWKTKAEKLRTRLRRADAPE